jgi:hypothetical protein
MTNWLPLIDLVRLLEALDEEIIAATDREIHQACAEGGHSVRTTANETRKVIGAATGDPDDRDAPITIATRKQRGDFVYKQH